MPVTTRAIRSTREEKRTSLVYWRSAQRSNRASRGPDANANSMAPRAITLTGLCSQKRSKIGPSSMAAPSGRTPYPGHGKELTTQPAHVGSPGLTAYTAPLVAADVEVASVAPVDKPAAPEAAVRVQLLVARDMAGKVQSGPTRSLLSSSL